MSVRRRAPFSARFTSDEARYLLLGVTSGGRHAALVFTRRGDKLRPISCRAMRKIILSDELKAALRKRGQELGVGYQTAAKMILAKYANAKL